MISDDTPIPGHDAPKEDAIARAAREGLGELAGPGPAHGFSWAVVETRARRVQRRRLAAVGGAFAIVLLGGGTAVAAVNHNASGHVNVAAGTSTTIATTTSAPGLDNSSSAPTTATVVGGPNVSGDPDGGSTTVTTMPEAQPGDLDGTLTLASTTLVAEHPTAFTLTVRNITDHPISFASLPVNVMLGTGLEGVGIGEWDYGTANTDGALTLAPGEQQTSTGKISPGPESIGPHRVMAAFLHFIPMDYGASADYISGVPGVPVTVVPPGWSEGQPLDPSQGVWAATMAADASTAVFGAPVIVRATLRNAGTQPQQTRGFASLAIVCDGSVQLVHFIDAATLSGGATQTFSSEFRFDPPPEGGDQSAYECYLGIGFDDDLGYAHHRTGVGSDSVSITVTAPTDTTVGVTNPTTTTTGSP